MEFAIGRNVLADELGKLSSAIAKKITIPILGCIKIESTEEGLKLTATDMETTLWSNLKSNLLAVTQPGAMCVPASRIIDIVRLAADGPMKITSDANDWIHIISARSRFKIPGMPVATFPATPDYSNISWLEIPAAHLKALLPAVKYAITTEESRLNLRGAKLEIKDGEVKLVATDGCRCSVASGKLESLMLDDYEVMIPVEGVDNLVKLLPDQTESIGVGLSGTLFFRVGSRVLSTRLLTGKFPGYQMLFQGMGTYEHSGRFKADDLVAPVKRAMLCAKKEATKTSAIVLAFEAGLLKISAADANLGEANEVVDSNFTGTIKVFCNGRFLLDFLEPAGSEVVKIEIKDSMTQMYLTSERNGIKSQYVLMPMRGVG